MFLTFGILVSCSKPKCKSLYEKCINSYREQGFESIEHILADTIILKDIGGFEAKYPLCDFKVFYQWDSAFKPHFEIIDFSNSDSTLDVTLSVSSLRFEFLGNNPLTTRKRIYFENDKIKTIDNLEYLNVDWTIWTAKRDSLVNWINLNYQELSGFINEITPNGAANYIEAIKLYNDAH